MGFGAIELQIMRFVQIGGRGIDAVSRTVAPDPGQIVDDPRHRFGIVVVRAEVPAFSVLSTFGVELFGKRQIARERFEHMLPGPDRIRAADHDLATFFDGAHDIGNQPIQRPVAAANHVAGAA